MKAAYFGLALLALVACTRAEDPPLPGICTLPRDPGDVCSTARPSNRYAYNLSIRKCEYFTYNGCAGNSNNFDTLLECQRTCKEATPTTVPPTAPPTTPPTTPPTPPPTTPPTTTQSWLPGACTHEISVGNYCPPQKPSNRYGYFISKRQCAPFTYNGCGGNANNFDTMVECRKTCERNY